MEKKRNGDMLLKNNTWRRIQIIIYILSLIVASSVTFATMRTNLEWEIKNATNLAKTNAVKIESQDKILMNMREDIGEIKGKVDTILILLKKKS